MKFIKLTMPSDGRPFFVRPDALIAFGPIPEASRSETRESWVLYVPDGQECYVRETCDQISRLLGA